MSCSWCCGPCSQHHQLSGSLKDRRCNRISRSRIFITTCVSAADLRCCEAGDLVLLEDRTKQRCLVAHRVFACGQGQFEGCDEHKFITPGLLPDGAPPEQGVNKLLSHWEKGEKNKPQKSQINTFMPFSFHLKKKKKSQPQRSVYFDFWRGTITFHIIMKLTTYLNLFTFELF